MGKRNPRFYSQINTKTEWESKCGTARNGWKINECGSFSLRNPFYTGDKGITVWVGDPMRILSTEALFDVTRPKLYLVPLQMSKGNWKPHAPPRPRVKAFRYTAALEKILTIDQLKPQVPQPCKIKHMHCPFTFYVWFYFLKLFSTSRVTTEYISIHFNLSWRDGAPVFPRQGVKLYQKVPPSCSVDCMERAY